MSIDWQNFEKVPRNHPDIFPPEFKSKDLFYSVFALVTTRCFGIRLESTSMIPVADMSNHHSVNVHYEVMNSSLHIHGKANVEYFAKSRFLTNFSAAYGNMRHSPGKENGEKVADEDQNLTEEQIANIRGYLDEKMYRLHNECLSVKNVGRGLEQRQVW